MRRTILITGASSGIGAAFARAYAARGYDLVLTARRFDRLQMLAFELSQKYRATCTPIAADLAQADAHAALFSSIAAQGLTIDGLINNAGFSVPQSFAAVSLERHLAFVQTCVTAPTALIARALPGMLARGWGRIINVSSVVVFSPGAAGHTLYPAAKSYLWKFSRSLAAEVASHGVKVTALCPGSTESEFADANGMRAVLERAPKRPTMSAEAVVDIAIRANERGQEVVVPGLLNKFAAAAMGLLPDPLVTALVRKGAEHYRLIESAPNA